MTAPKIVRTGTLRAHGRDVEVTGSGCLSLAIDATPDDTEDARAMHETRVRVTIEPADAPVDPPAGSPLDYLSQARRLIESGDLDAFCDAGGLPLSESPGAMRLISLLNTAHVAFLVEQRGAR